MGTRSTKKTIPAGEVRSLAKALSQKPAFEGFSVWLVGDTPLITHSWSEKARIEMLSKQVKAVKGGKEARDPRADFVSSLYEMGDKVYGFPATGIKNCILSAAHKDKGVARSGVMAALWLDADMVRTRPALAGATCDMPLIRIFGSKPEMREDMVKVGSGLNKTASLAYRAQFSRWAMRVTGRYNASVLSSDALAFLIQEAGLSYGIGEWRNERKGMFGSFHLATEEEEAEWEAYAAGKGDLPVPYEYAMAAE
jgi:hypothetical protein